MNGRSSLCGKVSCLTTRPVSAPRRAGSMLQSPLTRRRTQSELAAFRTWSSLSSSSSLSSPRPKQSPRPRRLFARSSTLAHSPGNPYSTTVRGEGVLGYSTSSATKGHRHGLRRRRGHLARPPLPVVRESGQARLGRSDPLVRRMQTVPPHVLRASSGLAHDDMPSLSRALHLWRVGEQVRRRRGHWRGVWQGGRAAMVTCPRC